MAATKDDLASLPTLLGSSNYPMWSCRLTAFLTYKKLFAVVTVDPGPRPTQAVKDQLSEAAHILGNKIGDKIYNGIVTPARNTNGYAIWTKVTRLYGSNTTHTSNRALARWNHLRYKGNLTTFLEQVESCLAEFASIGKVHEEGTICGTIIAKISIKRPGVTDPLLMNDVLMNDSEMLIEKLKDLASHEEMVHKNPHAEKHANAFNSNGRTRPKPG
ncbi:hypothetical protein PSTG_18379, partial [Puccinia striiformis f. sp. tritici PST-78]